MGKRIVKDLIVERIATPNKSTFTYVASASITSEMDRATALEHPDTEQWLIENMYTRLWHELQDLEGAEVHLRKLGDER